MTLCRLLTSFQSRQTATTNSRSQRFLQWLGTCSQMNNLTSHPVRPKPSTSLLSPSTIPITSSFSQIQNQLKPVLTSQIPFIQDQLIGARRIIRICRCAYTPHRKRAENKHTHSPTRVRCYVTQRRVSLCRASGHLVSVDWLDWNGAEALNGMVCFSSPSLSLLLLPTFFVWRNILRLTALVFDRQQDLNLI